MNSSDDELQKGRKKQSEWDPGGIYISGQKITTPPKHTPKVSFCLGSRVWCPSASVPKQNIRRSRKTVSPPVKSNSSTPSPDMLARSYSQQVIPYPSFGIFPLSQSQQSNSSLSSLISNEETESEISTKKLKQQLSATIKQLGSNNNHQTCLTQQYCKACDTMSRNLEKSAVKAVDTNEQEDVRIQKHVCLEVDSDNSDEYDDHSGIISDMEDEIETLTYLTKNIGILRRQDTNAYNLAPSDWRIEEEPDWYSTKKPLKRQDTTACSIAPPEWRIKEIESSNNQAFMVETTEETDTEDSSYEIMKPIIPKVKTFKRQNTNEFSIAPPDWRIEENSNI